jgi:putative ABC transport system permease protein
MNDFRFALRMLLKSPTFSIVAIATLALGIGANTAIFSVIESALLRPLPFPKADRLVRLYETFEENGIRSDLLNLSEKTVRQWRDYGGDIFEGIGVATGASVSAANPDQAAQSFQAARISANFLDVLGLQPALGRNFTAAEDLPGGPRVVIVGYDFWQRNLGGRADVLGNTIKLDGASYTIVGVMPKTFRHPYRAQIWLPIALNFAVSGQRNRYLYGSARLRPGITVAQADTAARRMCAAIKQSDPDPGNALRAYLIPLRDSFIGSPAEAPYHRWGGPLRLACRRGKFRRVNAGARVGTRWRNGITLGAGRHARSSHAARVGANVRARCVRHRFWIAHRGMADARAGCAQP